MVFHFRAAPTAGSHMARMSQTLRLLWMCFMLALAVVVSGEEDLFDKVYTMHMRDSAWNGEHGPIECEPRTGEKCSEREKKYTKEVIGLNLKQLKNQTAVLRKFERDAAQKGKMLKGDDDKWLMQRKSILYHLIDDAERKATEKKRAANARWAKGHDEL